VNDVFEEKEGSHMKPCGFWSRLPLVTLIVIVTFFSMIAVPAWSQPSSSDKQEGTASGAGMQAASVGLTILYFPFKGAYAVGGGIVGGLAYLLTGFQEQPAKDIWIPSMYGTYLITPEHLTGERAIRFVGVAAENDGAQAESAIMSSTAPEPVQ
jgi:hypothetical protein